MPKTLLHKLRLARSRTLAWIEAAELLLLNYRVRLAKVDMAYEELAEKLNEHGLNETRDSIATKLKRRTFAATFLIGVIAALELEGVKLKNL